MAFVAFVYSVPSGGLWLIWPDCMRKQNKGTGPMGIVTVFRFGLSKQKVVTWSDTQIV